MSVFSDGLPERPSFPAARPDEYRTKTCGACMRCTENRKPPGEWHCSDIGHKEAITPDAPACEIYWDRAAQEALDLQHDQDVEARRKELWAVYKDKPPVSLPIVNDGFGMIPECPVCGEMPYSTEQCYWCGQRFIQDATVEAYNDPGAEVRMDCPNCNGENTLIGHRSRYNGHFHGTCEQCGCTVME